MQHLALFEESNSLPRVAVENVTDIYDTFKQCEIANSAAEAISNEIALCNLQWSAEDAVSDTIKSSTWTTFVKHALVQMLVTGVVVWKKIAPREGSTAARVLQPSEYVAHYDENFVLVAKEIQQSQYRKKTYIRTIYAPDFVTGHITAPAKMALKLSKRYKTLIALFEQRNEINSQPAVFTTVSKDISAGQDTTTWFSSKNRAGIHDRDFNALVAQRQRAIHELSSLSKRRRVEETGNEEMMHKEYIISDGQQPLEIKTLIGQHDERAFRDQTANAILKCYNVDPQVMGQNVNSERAGLGLGSSSHAMTTRAINNFDAMIDRYIDFLNLILAEASKTPAGASLSLKRPIKESTIQKWQCFSNQRLWSLTTPACTQSIQQTLAWNA